LRARVAQRAKTARADLAVATVKNSEAAAQVANANARLETLEKRAAEALMRSSEIASLSSRESSVTNSRSTRDRRKRPSETVVFYISGEPDTPGNVYRVERYVESLVEAGVRASWTGLDDVPANAQKIAEADLVIIWRAAWDERVAFAIETAHRNGVRIIYDIDDLLIDPDLVRMELIDGIRRSGLSELDWRAHCSRFQTTMMKSVICTAPTQELATHMRRLGRPALVLPNTFGYDTYAQSRSATRRRRAQTGDGLIRIGYAGGTSTHQRDFELIAEALARVLSERPQCRLVLFQFQHNGTTEHRVDIKEFSLLQGMEKQIEWRDTVSLAKLPEELARFDINLAPVEVGNVFCESKSELKYFEAALVDVPTIASPTGPYRRAIRNGVTGLLANSPDDWYEALIRLIDDPVLSERISRAAHRDALARFGPLRRADETMAALPLLRGDARNGARAFAFAAQRRQTSHPPAVSVPECEVLFESDQFGSSELTVVLPLGNILQSAVEALETIRAQTLERFDLIVVANESSSQPGSPAADWVRQNAERFNRLVLLQISDNSSRSLARNAGIDKAETLYVFPLDPGYRLSPGCLAAFLEVIQKDRSPFVYSIFCQSESWNDPNDSLTAGLYANGQRIPVTGLVTKEAWAAVGGYAELTYGADSIDFWLKLIEQGWLGSQTGDESLIGADPASIESELKERKSASQMIEELAPRHPWLAAR
jgi:glycosyltransferase involved in cell wall biosynthesis